MRENQAIALRVLEAKAILINSAEQLWHFGASGDYAAFEQYAKVMMQTLQGLISEGSEGIPVPSFETVADSLRRITALARARSHKTLDKIEFELLPILKELYVTYYFDNCVYPDRNLMEQYYRHDMVVLGANESLDEAVRTGRYKYDLSVVVLAFNRLDYTKLCIENLLKHIPQDINYELILINHGSTDGTREFFESVAPTKQLDILVNGCGIGAYARITEGKYYLEVSNDVIVTENAIRNMVRCMDSDEKIAWVVPTTPNVSNLQAIPAEYDTIDEMHEFAKKNNLVADPCRWEQRTRLCNPISLRRTSAAFSSYGVHWSRYFHTHLQHAFFDDREALFYRRNGYKMMLAKDSYCHHFGSVTLKDEVAKTSNDETLFYDKGRKAFYDAFGIDPWGAGAGWSPPLMSLLACREEGHVDILGVNCGMGGNPLKIKESLKENVRNLDVTLYNVTDDGRYAEDLRGVSDVCACVERHSDMCGVFPGVRFDYIVCESDLGAHPAPLDMVKELGRRVTDRGFMAFQTEDEGLRKTLCAHYPAARIAESWCVVPCAGGGTKTRA
jgi:O-antigen biosynthesis protein